MSLASHSEGEGGNDNFDVCLMAKPEHRKIVPLRISDRTISWIPAQNPVSRMAKDSRRVACLVPQRPPCGGAQSLNDRKPPAVGGSNPVPRSDRRRCRPAGGHASQRSRNDLARLRSVYAQGAMFVSEDDGLCVARAPMAKRRKSSIPENDWSNSPPKPSA
jgi:hypothetical protein